MIICASQPSGCSRRSVGSLSSAWFALNRLNRTRVRIVELSNYIINFLPGHPKVMRVGRERTGGLFIDFLRFRLSSRQAQIRAF